MLGFEVWKNEEKLVLAGLREQGVPHVTLAWVGNQQGASDRAAASDGVVPDMDFRIGGIDGSGPESNRHVKWFDGTDFRVGDTIRVRIVSADVVDAPMSTKPVRPAQRREGDVKTIQCSFCQQMVRTAFKSGVVCGGMAGPEVFMCIRCLVLAERVLNGQGSSLFHLHRSTDETCSFCSTKHAPSLAASEDTRICKSCVDMVVKAPV